MTVHPWPKPERRPAKPRKPIKRGKLKKHAKGTDKWRFQYGSEERRTWVGEQLSVWSGKGPCVNAHTARRKGMSLKGHYSTIVPLTEPEHRAFDRRLAPFDDPENRRKVESRAPEIERRWLAHCGGQSPDEAGR